MSNHKKAFEKGDLIFAKVRGYPAWPARVESQIDSPNPKNARYKVFFYGTYQTAVCKAEEIFDFKESKEKMGTPKKHKFFNDAMREIETRPNIGPPVNKDSPPSSPEQVLLSDDEEDKSYIKKTLKSGNKTAVKRSRSTSSSSQIQNKKFKVNSDSDSETPVKVERRSETSAKLEKHNAELEETASSSSKKKSSSKSKTPVIALKTPAKMSDDEDEEYLHDDDDSESSSPEYSDIESDNTKNQSVKNKQESEEQVQVTMTRRQALNLLTMEEIPISLRNKVCENLMSKFIGKNTKIGKLESKESKLQFLRGELKLLTIERKLKNLLGRNKIGEISAALALLDELDSVKIQPLMLKKQPKFVETINKLCRYTGCVEQWGLEEIYKNKFLKEASEMREKASQIYQTIKNLFAVPDDTSFIEWFMREARHLREIVSSTQHFVIMTQEPVVVDLEADVEIGEVVEKIQQQSTDNSPIKEETEISKDKATAENEESVSGMHRPPLQSIPLNNSLTEEIE